MRRIIETLILGLIISETLAVNVILPDSQKSVLLFASVTLRCDYTTSAQLQNVIVSWTYKSFCQDPVLQYFSTAYQSALQMGQDPTNDCLDSQRIIRTVAQKLGSSDAVLGPEYKNRKIYIQNQADLVINEVMWWDNGMYFCSVSAPGDTVGDPDKEMRLIVYNWLTVLLIVFGGLLLIILFGVCCCQCCPQKCCCYVRCPCCPQTCCCPEKAIMQHRLMQEAQKAMTPWLHGQPIYSPMSNHSSTYQMNPLLYGGSVAGKSGVSPVPLPPPHMAPMAFNVPPPSLHENGSVHGNKQVLDYLENQMRGIDGTNPQYVPPAPQHMPHSVPFSAGPPSMLSGLDEGPGSRRAPRGSSGYRPREPSYARSGMSRSYSQDDVLENQSHYGGNRPRSRSRDDLLGEERRGSSRMEEYSHAPRSQWGSGHDRDGRHHGSQGGRSGRWTDRPPNYREYEPGRKPKKDAERFSEKSSHSGTSVII